MVRVCEYAFYGEACVVPRIDSVGLSHHGFVPFGGVSGFHGVHVLDEVHRAYG